MEDRYTKAETCFSRARSSMFFVPFRAVNMVSAGASTKARLAVTLAACTI